MNGDVAALSETSPALRSRLIYGLLVGLLYFAAGKDGMMAGRYSAAAAPKCRTVPEVIGAFGLGITEGEASRMPCRNW